MEDSGFKPEVQPLKHFEDDYGLKVGDEDEEEESEEDEDYELVEDDGSDVDDSDDE